MKMTEPRFFESTDWYTSTASDAGSIKLMDNLDKTETGFGNGFGDGTNAIYVANNDFTGTDKLPKILEIGLDSLKNPIEDDGGLTEWPEMVGLLHIRNPRGTAFASFDCSMFWDQLAYSNFRRGTYLVMNCQGLALEKREPDFGWPDWSISVIMARISPAIIRKSDLITDTSAHVLDWGKADLETDY